MLKICKKCLLEKNMSDFYSGKGCKDGTWHTCKSCSLIKQNAYNNSRKEIRKRQAAERYIENKEHILKTNKRWKDNNKEKSAAIIRKWQKNNKDKTKVSYLKNREKRIAAGVLYSKKRMAVDPLYKLKIYLRNRICQSFRNKGMRKSVRSAEMLGADIVLVKKYIEKKFKKGMYWSNYGEWHLDHIIPLSSASTEDDLKKLCHYTNLQPLWAKENNIKSDKIPQVQIKLTI